MQNNIIRMPYMLSERHFAITMMVALVVHLSGFVVWSISPKQKVQDIPIRMLNIRLGDEETTPENTDANAFPTNAPQIEAIVDAISHDAIAQAQAPKADNNIAKQYVREINTPRLKTSGKPARNGARDAEIMSRYTQMISMWIQKFIIYPDEARSKKLTGSTMVRIRIDRRGTIRYYALERSTGSELLDRAAIDMIRRANPVPAVPSDYPPGELFEFLIPVNFSVL